ncbi:MAG: hypothetical protein GX294_05245 [Candidatus Cloacimonetes bacterium]|nr:hypothetical protein [Candidatus Cloacimonadota bacterium]
MINNKEELDSYERAFERHKSRYDLTPDELHNARKHGFYPRSYLIYDFKKWGMAQFLAERDFHKLDFRERGLSPATIDKRNLPLLLQNNAHYLPSLNIAIDKGRVQYIIENGSYQEGDFDLEELLQSYLKKYAKLIVKPISLCGGRGIFTIANTISEDTIKRIEKEGNAIINNVLINEEYAYRINPSSLNTIRVIFFKTKKGVLKPISMVHRFGSTANTCVDNTSAGGVVAGVDIETGGLKHAYTLERKRNDLDTHPLTREKINGLIIPDWSSKKRAIDDLLQEINYLEYGGLDVAFTTEGFKIIEINKKPDFQGIQHLAPALINEEFVEFLRLRGFQKPNAIQPEKE